MATTTPTISTVTQSLLDNADYSAVNSIVKARAFLLACNQYFILMPSATSNGGTSAAYSVSQIEKMRDEALMFIRMNSTPSGRVKFLSVRNDYR